MKNFTEFTAEVMENIKNYLSEEYQDADMRIEHQVKAGYEYDSLIITKKSDVGGYTIAPALNLTSAYSHYCEVGEDIDSITKELARIRMQKIPEFNRDDIANYVRASERIFPRLLNYENNKNYLKGKLYKRVADLAVCYDVRLKEDNTGVASCCVTDGLSELWGVSPEEIDRCAFKNLSERKPLFMNMVEALAFVDCDRDISDVEVDGYTAPFFVLTSKSKCKGSAYVLVPEVMDKVTELLGGDIYVIPSSVDEVIVLPKTAADDVDFLNNMLRTINAEEVKPEDRLSNNVYEYRAEEGELVIAE